MKPINLINTLSAHQHHALARWFSLTLASAIVLVTILTCISIYQTVSMYSAKWASESMRKKWAPALTALAQHQDLQQQICHLKRGASIPSGRMRNPLTVITACTGGPGTWIDQFRYGAGECELQIICAMHGSERTLLSSLSAHPAIKEASIQSIKQKSGEKQLLTIKALVR